VSKSFTATDPGGSHEGKTNTWLTPRSVLNRLGKFDLDPCGFQGWDTARKHYYENGLEQKWSGRIWLNPPYGRTIIHWLKKLQDHGNGVALIFVRTDTKWFQSLEFDSMNLIKGRIAFLNKNKIPQGNAGTPSCLLAWGSQNMESIENIDGRIFYPHHVNRPPP